MFAGGKIIASLSEGDLQEVRSTLAGFAEKREVARFAVSERA